MNYRDSASFGKRQEFAAISGLLRRDFDVYRTLVDIKESIASFGKTPRHT